MKIKTSELTGAALDWAAAWCEGCVEKGVYGGPVLRDGRLHIHYCGVVLDAAWQPSTDWSQAGPILTREHISRTTDHSGLWIAYWTDGYTEGDEGKKWMQCDRSELVAGLRCYVASRLGDEVDVPEELR